jgi:signal transduction histidine kinase
MGAQRGPVGEGGIGPAAPSTSVLVADADSAARSYAQERLAAEGFIVTVADGAQTAMSHLAGGDFDILLTTLDLPDSDGVSLIAQVRADADLARLPIAVIVHRDEIEAMDRAFEAGATAFVARPFHWPALAHQIRFVLRAAKQAEDLREARDRAVEADRFKSNMLRLLQHELRTPLASIVGFSEEIVRAPASRYSAEFAQHVVKAGRDLNRQFTALFASAQVIAGDVAWDFEPIKAQDLFDQIQLGEEALAVERRVVVRYLLDCPSAKINLDARYLPKALRHLVRNAIVHGAVEGGRVDVIATAERDARDGERVLFIVRDGGRGFSESNLEHCLQPFAQGEDALTRAVHGFGLGLPFARRVIESHGGQMKVVTAPEGGCIVTVVLPAELPAHQTIGQMRAAAG